MTSNIQSMVSDTQSMVSDTQNMVSNIHRTIVQSQEGGRGAPPPVSDTRILAIAERSLIIS